MRSRDSAFRPRRDSRPEGRVTNAWGLSDFTIWNITDLANPRKVAEFADPDATVHNAYIINNLLIMSYYAAGLKVFDLVTRKAWIGEFDTDDIVW